MTKKLCFVFVAVLLVASTLLCGCDMPYGKATSYTFLQDWTNVVKVEICYHNTENVTSPLSPIGPLTTISILSESQTASLKKDLLELPACEVRYIDGTVGELIFVVTYSNGEQEWIGLHLSAKINPDGSFHSYCPVGFGDGPHMVRIFVKYADPEILAEYMEDFWDLYNLADEY